jgi:hypothetical protein
MIQAVSLAFAGSFYPVGLLFVLRYIAASRGLYLATLFVIGGALGCLVISVLELALLHSLPVQRADNPAANGAVYIALGAGLLLICGVVAVRGHRRPIEIAPTAVHPADPGARRAFVTGLIVYSPGLGLLAAVKALFDAALPASELVLGLVVCIAIILWMAEVPITATALSPRRSAPVLRRVGGFIARHGRSISLAIGVGFGGYLIADGMWIATGH